VKWLWEDLKDKLDPLQFGSVKNSSTVHALVELLHSCFNDTDTGKGFIRLLLLDYTKAFDLINHRILISKLHDLKVTPFLISWISSFLIQRSQKVKIGTFTSAAATLNGGVPQGTILGPVLSLIMINDLSLPCKSLKYVDDTTVVFHGTDPQSPNLQFAADIALAWSKANCMQINPAKTKEICISFSRKQLDFLPILINDTNISQVESAKVLGITISDNLKWNNHINNIVKKTSQRLFMLSQCRRSGLKASDMIQIYTTKIRPILEYACQAWHPGLPAYLHDDIEQVQRRALKIIFPSLSYAESLLKSSLQPLQERRNLLCKKFLRNMCHHEHKLHHLLPPLRSTHHHVRNRCRYQRPKTKTKRADGCLVNWGLIHYANEL
jgi:hypothetical protein